MASNYLGAWMDNELFCPFCGEKAFPLEEPGLGCCEHLLVDMSEGIIWYASDDFFKIANEFYGLSEEVMEDKHFDGASIVDTRTGRIQVSDLLDRVLNALKNHRVRLASFDLDIGSDVVQLIFCKDDLSKLRIVKPELTEIADTLRFELAVDDVNKLPESDPRQSEFQAKFVQISNDVWKFDDGLEAIKVTIGKHKQLCAEYGISYRYPNKDVEDFIKRVDEEF